MYCGIFWMRFVTSLLNTGMARAITPPVLAAKSAILAAAARAVKAQLLEPIDRRINEIGERKSGHEGQQDCMQDRDHYNDSGPGCCPAKPGLTHGCEPMLMRRALKHGGLPGQGRSPFYASRTSPSTAFG